MKQKEGGEEEEPEEESMWVSAAVQKGPTVLPLHRWCLQLYVFIREEMHSHNWLSQTASHVPLHGDLVNPQCV